MLRKLWFLPVILFIVQAPPAHAFNPLQCLKGIASAVTNPARYLERFGWISVTFRRTPIDLEEHPEVQELLRAMEGRFEGWSHLGEGWTSSYQVAENLTMWLTINTRSRTIDVAFTHPAYVNYLEDGIRRFARALVLAHRADPAFASPHAQTSGINGERIEGLPFGDVTTLVVLNLARVKQDQNLTELTSEEQAWLERWFVGKYNQRDNAGQHVILFRDIIKTP